MLKLMRRTTKLSTTMATLLGLVLLAWMGRSLGPEMVRYARIKSM